MRNTHPDDDSVREPRTNTILHVATVSTERYDELEIPLVRVGFSPLTHVVRCRLAEVKSTDDHLHHLLRSQVDPSTIPQCNSYKAWRDTLPSYPDLTYYYYYYFLNFIIIIFF